MDEGLRGVKNFLEKTLASYAIDPPVSDFQNGHEAALELVYGEVLGLETRLKDRPPPRKKR